MKANASGCAVAPHTARDLAGLVRVRACRHHTQPQVYAMPKPLFGACTRECQKKLTSGVVIRGIVRAESAAAWGTGGRLEPRLLDDSGRIAVVLQARGDDDKPALACNSVT